MTNDLSPILPKVIKFCLPNPTDPNIMTRLLYEYSIADCGHLIIPYVFGTVDPDRIYSYQLLSELGHRGNLHKAHNPAGIHSCSLEGIMAIAKEHLDIHSDVEESMDAFKHRYTYRENLIIIYQMADKFFYDHYKPDNLQNVAAPKIFKSEQACIHWVKSGLDRPNEGSNVLDFRR